MNLRNLLLLLSAASWVLVGGCASVATESSEPAAARTASDSATETEPSRPTAEASAVASAAEKVAAAPADDTPRSTFRAEREARAASAASAASKANEANAGGARSGSGAEAAKLLEQLSAATKELATLRVANAKLRAERAPVPAATLQPVSARIDPAEEKLAASVKSYAAFKQEMMSMFAEAERVRHENAALAGNLKSAVGQADEARANTLRLEEELRAEQKARAAGEKVVAQLREQLRAVARAVSAAGLNVETLSGGTEAAKKR